MSWFVFICALANWLPFDCLMVCVWNSIVSFVRFNLLTNTFFAIAFAFCVFVWFEWGAYGIMMVSFAFDFWLCDVLSIETPPLLLANCWDVGMNVIAFECSSDFDAVEPVGQGRLAKMMHCCWFDGCFTPGVCTLKCCRCWPDDGFIDT